MTSRAVIGMHGRSFDIVAPTGYTLFAVMTYILNFTAYRKLSDLAPNGGIRTIWDIGANIGGTALAFSLAFPEAQIIAVEPIKRNLEMLDHNCAGCNVRTSNLAVSDSVGIARIAMPTLEQRPGKRTPDEHVGNTGLYSLYGKGDDAETVSTTTLDLLVGENPADLLKIDVEGAENLVIAGAQNVLQKQRPIIVMETREENQAMGGWSNAELARQMARQKYSAYFSLGSDVVFIPG